MTARFQVAVHRTRPESGFELLHLGESGSSLATSEVGAAVLRLLQIGLTGDDIVEVFSKNGPRDYRESVRSFLQASVELGLLTEERAVARSGETIGTLWVSRLEDAVSNGSQCPTFGMPKRSCRALPSGVDPGSGAGKKEY